MVSGGRPPLSFDDLLGELPEEPDDGWSTPLLDPTDAADPAPPLAPRYTPPAPQSLSWAEIAALTTAEDVVSRLDQAALLASDAVRVGLHARLAAHEASAWLGAQGHWIHPRDLALHEGGLVASIAAAVSGGRARDALPATLAGRRDAEVHALLLEDIVDETLMATALSLLRLLQRLPGARDPLGLVLSGRPRPTPSADRPALLQAHALACQVPEADAPEPSLMAAAWLAQQRLRAVFVPVWTGLQTLRRARCPTLSEVTAWCQAAEAGGRAGLQELQRLQQIETRGREVAAQLDRRSRLPEVVTEILRQPVVTSVGLARRLQITPQATSRLLHELEQSGLVTEVTGRMTWRVYAAALR